MGLEATWTICLSKSSWHWHCTLQGLPLTGFPLGRTNLLLIVPLKCCTVTKGSYLYKYARAVVYSRDPHREGKNEPFFSEFIIQKQDERQIEIQLREHKDTMRFCFFTSNLISTSRLRVKNEIVKYSGLNIYLRAFAFSHINYFFLFNLCFSSNYLSLHTLMAHS